MRAQHGDTAPPRFCELLRRPSDILCFGEACSTVRLPMPCLGEDSMKRHLSRKQFLSLGVYGGLGLVAAQCTLDDTPETTGGHGGSTGNATTTSSGAAGSTSSSTTSSGGSGGSSTTSSTTGNAGSGGS